MEVLLSFLPFTLTHLTVIIDAESEPAHIRWLLVICKMLPAIVLARRCTGNDYSAKMRTGLYLCSIGDAFIQLHTSGEGLTRFYTSSFELGIFFFLLAHISFMRAISCVSDRAPPIWFVAVGTVAATAVCVPCLIFIKD